MNPNATEEEVKEGDKKFEDAKDHRGVKGEEVFEKREEKEEEEEKGTTLEDYFASKKGVSI